jgi:biopolymer transport protein TolR
MGMSGSTRRMQSEMNVTPMIDILLVLLIIFMMIPAPKGLEAIVPQDSPDPQKPQEENVVVIQLSPGAEADAPPSVKLNQQPVTWKEFPDALAKLFVKRTNKSAFLKADGELDFQQVASVIDIAHNSGVVYVGLMTKLPER